jgi:hypothetical protein
MPQGKSNLFFPLLSNHCCYNENVKYGKMHDVPNLISYPWLQTFGIHTFPIHFDHGGGFGKSDHDEMSILAPLYQVHKYLELVPGTKTLIVIHFHTFLYIFNFQYAYIILLLEININENERKFMKMCEMKV